MTKIPSSKLLYTATILMDLCVGATILLLSLFGLHVTQRESIIGMLGALMILSRIPCNLIGGPISDRIGRRPMMVFAGGMLLAALGVLGSADTVWMLAVYSVLCGASAGLIWFNIEAALGDHGQGMDLHHRTGYFNLSFSTGMIIGPWLIGQVFTFSEMAALWVTVAAAATVTLCLSIAPLSPIESHDEQVPRNMLRAPKRYFQAALLTNLIIWIGVGVVRFLLPKQVVDLGYTSAVVGNLSAICYGFMMAGFIWLKFNPKWHYQRWPMIVALLLGILGAGLLGLSENMTVLVVGLALYGIAISFSYYSVIFAALDSPVGRGHRSGQHEAALAIGMIIGSQFGGILAEGFGPQAPYGGVVFMCIIAIGVVWQMASIRPGTFEIPVRPFNAEK